MKKEPLILSICIPTYSRSSYLKTCIDSLIAYKGEDIEVIVQDNHSEDDTETLMNSYVEIDSRISYEKNSMNLGMMENLFKAMERARGEYIFILSDDDFILSGGIEKIIRLIKNKNPTAFNCAKILYFEKSKRAIYYSAVSSRSDFDCSDIAKIIMFSHIFSGTSILRRLIDTKYLREFADTYYAHIVAFALASNNVAYIDEPIVFHVWENETYWGESEESIHKKNIESYTKIIKGLDKLDDALLERLVVELSLRHRKIPNELVAYLSKKAIKEVKWNILKLKIIDLLKILISKYRKYQNS